MPLPLPPTHRRPHCLPGPQTTRQLHAFLQSAAQFAGAPRILPRARRPAGPPPHVHVGAAPPVPLTLPPRRAAPHACSRPPVGGARTHCPDPLFVCWDPLRTEHTAPCRAAERSRRLRPCRPRSSPPNPFGRARHPRPEPPCGCGPYPDVWWTWLATRRTLRRARLSRGAQRWAAAGPAPAAAAPCRSWRPAATVRRRVSQHAPCVPLSARPLCLPACLPACVTFVHRGNLRARNARCGTPWGHSGVGVCADVSTRGCESSGRYLGGLDPVGGGCEQGWGPAQSPGAHRQPAAAVGGSCRGRHSYAARRPGAEGRPRLGHRVQPANPGTDRNLQRSPASAATQTRPRQIAIHGAGLPRSTGDSRTRGGH